MKTFSPGYHEGLPYRDDLAILSSALNGGADIFITGDKELLGLQKIGNMEIISPRMFWEKLKTQLPDEL